MRTDQFMSEIDRAFTVGLISQPVKGLPIGTRATKIRGFAKSNNISQVPLRNKDKEKKFRIEKIVEFNEKYEEAGDIRSVSIEEVISRGTPLSRAIPLLAERRFYLVLYDNHISEIVTISDLNLLAVRTYLFTLLANAEELLARWIDDTFPENGFMKILSREQQGSVNWLLKKMRRHDLHVGPINCTNLTHKFTVIEETPGMFKKLGYDSKDDFKNKQETFCRLRNRTHHGLHPVPSTRQPVQRTDEADKQDLHEFRNAIAHDDQIVWNEGDVIWLKECIELLQAWITTLEPFAKKDQKSAKSKNAKRFI